MKEKNCGLTIDWNYEKGYVDITTPGATPKTLARSSKQFTQATIVGYYNANH